MEEHKINNFIYFTTHNSKLTKEQKKVRDGLIARDLLKSVNESGLAPISAKSFVSLNPDDTYKFFSLFNDPSGLKYLTHAFDNADDNLQVVIDQARSLLSRKHNIPFSLKILIKNYVKGGGWIDTFGRNHNSYLSDPDWLSWSSNNGKHPYSNSEWTSEVETFRSTVRLVSPHLEEIINRAKENLNLNVTTEKLDRADFYVNTFVLRKAIERIFKMMEQAARDNDNLSDVHIKYKRDKDENGKTIPRIIISQINSFANRKNCDDIINIWKEEPDAGDFGAIRKWLNGYCYWQVETKWHDVPKRWNILRPKGTPELEKLEESQVTGFTHILTFKIV